MPTGMYVRTTEHNENNRLGHIGRSIRALRGKSTWNKGLTKETDERVKTNAEHCMVSHEGSGIYDRTNVVIWNTGLTLEDERIIRMVEKRSKTVADKISKGLMKEKWFDTLPERIMEENLLRSGFMLQKQVHIKGVGLVDFYLPEENVVIECDGDYWHGSDRPGQQEIDKVRTKQMKKLGYKVVRFWEYEILNDIQNCIERLN